MSIVEFYTKSMANRLRIILAIKAMNMRYNAKSWEIIVIGSDRDQDALQALINGMNIHYKS